MLAILVTSCRDTYGGGNGDGEVLMLDVAAGQAILKGELGISKAVLNACIVVKLIRRRRERDLKRPERNKLDTSVAAGCNQWDSIRRNLPRDVIDHCLLEVRG